MLLRLLAIVATLAFASCEKPAAVEDARETAAKKEKSGAHREAIRHYESALDGTAKTADIHYKIASIYDDKLKEHLDAIHHYDRYLDFAPTGTHAKEAKAARADCDRQLQMKPSKDGFMTTGEAVRLRNENEELRKIIADLRNPKPPPEPKKPDPANPDPLPPGARRHTVARGDTLGSLAVKYYKNRAYAGHIKDANFNQLVGKDIIRPGMILIIPEAPGKKKKP